MCFRVTHRAAVDAVGAARCAHGLGASEPRLYPEYSNAYYATFVSDPDGIRLEVVNQLDMKRPIDPAAWARIAPIGCAPRERMADPATRGRGAVCGSPESGNRR